MNTLEKRITDYLSRNLRHSKFRHSLGVAKMSELLANKHGASASKAYIAGLLHDCGRTIPVKKYYTYVKKHSIKLGPFKKLYFSNPFLLHGIIGRHVAGSKFKIKAIGVLDSISAHTVAKRSMSKLGKIVYLADMIAPDRRYAGVKMLRKKSFNDLNDAMIFALKIKLSKVLNSQRQIFPETVFLWNELNKKSNH
ncbi:MAG: bis(5'-nucleosyl)-tetraphosphatase (symmetrical) YqeK [bacterium]